MKKSILIQIMVGIAITAFILNKLSISDVVATISETNLFYFVLASLSYLGLNLVLTYRLNYLLSRIGYRIKFFTVFLSHLGGMIVGDITPGRSGYFLTPPLLKKNAGTRITDGMACIFAPQGLEFILKVAGAIAAIFYISRRSQISENILVSIGIGATLLFISGMVMLMISWHNETLTMSFLNRISFLKNMAENLSFFKERSIQVKDSINVILLLYMIGWMFAALQWFYLGKALGIGLSFLAFLLLHPLITILMFVPVSPAGLGVMEGGVILVFSFLGIPAATGLAFSVLVRVSIVLVDLAGLKTVLGSLKDIMD